MLNLSRPVKLSKCSIYGCHRRVHTSSGTIISGPCLKTGEGSKNPNQINPIRTCQVFDNELKDNLNLL